MATEHNNYEDYNETSNLLSISKIHDTPIVIGVSHTFGQVFGGINKIINAFKRKLNSMEDTYDSKFSNMEKRILGVTGEASVGSVNIEREKSQTIELVTLNGVYTHGYVKLSNNNFITISRLNPSVVLASHVVGLKVGDYYGHANYTLSMEYNESKTKTILRLTIKSETYNKGYANYQTNGDTLYYELY